MAHLLPGRYDISYTGVNKLSAGFERTSYVLTFDEEVVAAALGERYGEGGVEAGKKFLEKIIQVPLHLPPGDELALRKLVFEGVEAAVRLAGIELTEEQGQAFIRHFVDGLELQLTTPRQAKRYANALVFALPILKGEVNPVDQMLIEGIRVFYPKLYLTIRENPDLFLGSSREESRDEAFRKRAAEIVDRGLQQLDAEAKERVRRRLLEKLFPRLQGVFGNTWWGSDWEPRWEREQRIASRQYFDRYFSYSVPPGDVPDQVVAGFLERVSKGSDKDVDEVVKDLAEGGALRRLIPKLRRREDSIDGKTAGHLVMAIARNGPSIPREKTIFYDSTFSQAAILAGRLMLRVSPGSERDELARQVVRTAEPLPFAVECFRWLRTGKDEPESERVVLAEVEQELGEIMAERIRDKAAQEVLWRVWPEDSRAFFWIWETYGNKDEVATQLRERLIGKPDEITEFLATYVPTAWGLESGLPHKGDFERNAYDAVSELIDPEVLVAELRSQYGEEIDRAEYERSGDMPIGKRVAIQFAHIHRKVKEEAQVKSAEQGE